MDKKALTNIKPAIKLGPLLPAKRKMFSAMRSCRLDFCMLKARIKPPRNKKIFLFAYGIAVSANEETPSNGKKTSGNNAVTNNGIASEAHNMAIKTPTAATYHASELNPSGLGDRIITKNRVKPIKRPVFILVNFFFIFITINRVIYA